MVEGQTTVCDGTELSGNATGREGEGSVGCSSSGTWRGLSQGERGRDGRGRRERGGSERGREADRE